MFSLFLKQLGGWNELSHSPPGAFCRLVWPPGKGQRAVPGRAWAKAGVSSRSVGLTWQMEFEGNGKVTEAWDKGADGASGTAR